MKLQQQFHLHFYQQNTVWSEQDGGIFNRKCLASLPGFPGPLTRSERVLDRERWSARQSLELVCLVSWQLLQCFAWLFSVPGWMSVVRLTCWYFHQAKAGQRMTEWSTCDGWNVNFINFSRISGLHQVSAILVDRLTLLTTQKCNDLLMS